MSKSDRDARILQSATGARYVTCLARVRDLRTLAPIPILHAGLPIPAVIERRFHTALGLFMERVAALPALAADDQVRCVICLQPARECRCA